MAKLKFKPLVYDIRGKMGGSIFKKHPYSDQTVLEPARENRQGAPTSEVALVQQDRFKVADDYWKLMTLAEKNIWRAAVKKNHLTGYQLWMKECLGLFSQDKNGPDQPSCSGGFTYDKASEGENHPNPHKSSFHGTSVVILLGVTKQGFIWPYQWCNINLMVLSPGCGMDLTNAYCQICFPSMLLGPPCEPWPMQGPCVHWREDLQEWLSYPDIGSGPFFHWPWQYAVWHDPRGCFTCAPDNIGPQPYGFSVLHTWTRANHYHCGVY